MIGGSTIKRRHMYIPALSRPWDDSYRGVQRWPAALLSHEDALTEYVQSQNLANHASLSEMS